MDTSAEYELPGSKLLLLLVEDETNTAEHTAEAVADSCSSSVAMKQTFLDYCAFHQAWIAQERAAKEQQQQQKRATTAIPVSQTKNSLLDIQWLDYIQSALAQHQQHTKS